MSAASSKASIAPLTSPGDAEVVVEVRGHGLRRQVGDGIEAFPREAGRVLRTVRAARLGPEA
ncbi:MAG: hypothetical protein ACYSXF_10395 [Planctomycetota bacterium]|jgi:hypothetical protein